MKTFFYGISALAMLAALCRGQGIITTIAGSGTAGFGGDGGPATSAKLLSPNGLAIDSAGNVYIGGGGRVRKVNAAGIISSVAGTGSVAYSGDGGLATSAGMDARRLAVDSAGNIYICDFMNNRVRKVDTNGIVTTFAGNGGFAKSTGDGGLAVNASVPGPSGLALDKAGNFYISSFDDRIRKVDTKGIITTIAGTGLGASGDGGKAINATFNVPNAVALDGAGNLYISDRDNNRIRKVDTSGNISTYAGNGGMGFSGDGGKATSASLNSPEGIALDSAGNLYIADNANTRIRKVDTSGIITTIAGGAPIGSPLGDGGLATKAVLFQPLDVAVDASGNVYIADGSVRKVTPSSGSGPTPEISNLLDAAAYTAGIPQGGVFVVKGNNLCGMGTVYGSLPLSSAPLNNVKISFTPVAGGAGIDAYMVYTYGDATTTQLAAILPSTTPTGDYNVTVTNNGAVGPNFKATVVVRKFGIITVNGSGAGRAVVQNYISPTQYDLDRYTTGTIGGFTYSPAHPGQIIVIWGTGLGPINAPDNTAPGSIDMRGALNIQVVINGVPISPDLYAGRAPTLPGADEIVLTLPSNVATGCFLTMQVSVNGQLGNATNISIAPAAGASACVDPQFSAATLARLDQGGTATVGSLGISGGIDTLTLQGTSTTIRADGAGAFFFAFTPDQLGGNVQGPGTPLANGTCQVTRGILSIPSPGSPPPTPQLPQFLDTGTLLLNGPNVVNVPVGVVTTLAASVNGVTVVNGAVLAAGTYTITGSGGKDVGPFQATITMSQPLVVTGGLPSTISRNQDLTLAWTGGGTGPVTITGYSSVPAPGSTSANPLIDSGVFRCLTTADKGSFTIPTSVLQQLPASSPSSFGLLLVSSNAGMATFTAPLTAGGNLDYGYFYTGYSNQSNPVFK